MVQHQLAQQELEGSAALSYEDYLRRLTQAVDTEVKHLPKVAYFYFRTAVS